MLTVGSLFSGIGGFDLAFERAGCRVLWQVEIEPFPRRVLRARFAGAALHGDVTKVGVGREEQVEPVDVIVGGFPCQDLSVAGKREGLKGERSGLFFEFMRLVDELKPRWVVVENVPGLATSAEGRDFAVVLDKLAELGMGWAYRVLDSRFFGVPQRRRRVFVVGRAGGDGERAAAVLFEPEGGVGDPAPGGAAGTRVAATIRGRSAGAGVNEPGRGGEDDVNLIAFNPTAGTRDPQVGEIAPPLKVGTGLDIPSPPAIAFDWQSGGDVRHNASAEAASALQASQTPAVFQCHGTNVGEMGTLREGNGGVTGGVPFVAEDAAVIRWSHQGRDLWAADHVGALQAMGEKQGQGQAVAVPEPQAVHTNGRDEAWTADHTAALTSSGGKPGQGYQAVLLFDDVAATLNSGGNAGGFRTEPGEHLVAHALTSTMFKRHDEDTDTLIASSLQAHDGSHGVSYGLRGDGTDNLVPTLQASAGGHSSLHPDLLDAVAGTITATGHERRDHDDAGMLVASPLTASGGHHGHSSPRGDGADNLVAFKESQSGVRESDMHATLDAHKGSRRQEGVVQVVRTKNLHDDARGDVWLGDEPGALQAAGDTPNQMQAVHTGMAVRRLTPLECERLQAFPDGWSCLCGKGHLGTAHCECTDSARYKALGNAVTVSVVEWIARRLVLAERDEAVVLRVADVVHGDDERLGA